MVAITREIGIPMRGYFMLGFPGESRAEMEDTVRFAIELDLDIASFTLFVHFPARRNTGVPARSGTFDPEYYFHRILPEFNFPDSPVYVPEGFTAEELLDFHSKVYSRYYFRPKVILRKMAGIRRPREILDLLKGGYTLAANALHRWWPDPRGTARR